MEEIINSLTNVGVGTGLAVLGSKEILEKLLGPSADYIGNETKNLIAKCNINLDNIFSMAKKKTGSQLDDGSSVNPRVLKHIIDEGRFCEDELTAEYYGGILASSRSNNKRDDRAVAMLAMVKDLSVYQLRFHYIFYSIINKKFRGQDLNLGLSNDCNVTMKVFIPWEVFYGAMAFDETEDFDSILSHTLNGLDKHGLIALKAYGSAEFLHKQHGPRLQAHNGGMLLSPTLVGAELFLWAVGLSGASGRELLRVDVTDEIEGLVIPDGAKTIAEACALPSVKP